MTIRSTPFAPGATVRDGPQVIPGCRTSHRPDPAGAKITLHGENLGPSS